MKFGKQYAEDFEEGDDCPLVAEGTEDTPCSGKLHFPEVENCTCFKSAPCRGHTEQTLVCDTCHWEVEDVEL